ncbi:MAG: zinc-dependent alcohol dehydrogenase [Anaerolineae bacterium]|jgi:threonine dehydrogenase-like Zn-dependent dehydrogenase
MKARRLLFEVPGRARWEEWEVADSPGPGEVLLEARASVISAGTDVSIYKGTHINAGNPQARYPRYPHRPGGHVGGVVLAVGPGVEGFAPGDRVTYLGSYGTHQVMEAASGRVKLLPEGVSFEEGALASHSAVGLNGVRVSGLALGETAAVFGLGLIGQYTVRYALLAGASRVVGIDPIPERRQAAQAAGALVAAPGEPQLQEWFVSGLGEPGVDVAIEATGDPTVIPQVLQATSEFGRAVLLGSPRGRVEIDPYNDLHRKGIAVIGSNPTVQTPNARYPWTREQNLRVALSLLTAGRLSLADLVSDRVPAEQALEVFERLAAGPRGLGVVLEWGRDGR